MKGSPALVSTLNVFLKYEVEMHLATAALLNTAHQRGVLRLCCSHSAWECASRAAKRAGLAARAELLWINPGDQEGKNSARNFDSFCKEVKSIIKHEIGS